MNPETTSRDVLDSIARFFAQGIQSVLEALFGAGVQEPFLGSLTRADLGVILCFLMFVAVVNGLAAWLLRRSLKPIAAAPASETHELLIALGR